MDFISTPLGFVGRPKRIKLTSSTDDRKLVHRSTPCAGTMLAFFFLNT